MFGMNWETAKSLIAKVVAMIGVWVMAKYGLSSGTWEAITGIVMAVASLLWSVKANTPTSLVKAAESMEAVDSIKVNDQSISDATGPKVTKS